MVLAVSTIRDALNKQIVLNLVMRTITRKIRWKLGQLEHRTPETAAKSRLTVTDYLLLGQRGFTTTISQLMVRTRLTKQDDIPSMYGKANDPSIPDDLDMFDFLWYTTDSHFQECERYVNSTFRGELIVLGRSIRGLKPSDIELSRSINEMAMDEDIANLNSAASWREGKQNSKNGRAPTLPGLFTQINEHLLLVATAAFFKAAHYYAYVLLVKREDMPNTDAGRWDQDLTKYVVIQSGEPQLAKTIHVKRYAGVDVTIWPAIKVRDVDTDEKPLMYWLFGRYGFKQAEQLFLPGTSNLFVSTGQIGQRKVSIKFCKKPTKILVNGRPIHQPGICREHGGIFINFDFTFIRRGGLMNYYGTTYHVAPVMASFRVPGDPRPVQRPMSLPSRNNRGRSIINISSTDTYMVCRQMSPFEAFIFKLSKSDNNELTYDEIDNPKLPEGLTVLGVGYTQAKDGIHDRVATILRRIRKIKEAGEIVPFNRAIAEGCRGSTRWDDSLREAGVFKDAPSLSAKR
ncbi:hypothetical protein SPFM12_00214 [Salmonella phage SPFM12]|nr:hypothetical protein SPFM12_00214 [Salmonella phage SPFM12]